MSNPFSPFTNSPRARTSAPWQPSGPRPRAAGPGAPVVTLAVVIGVLLLTAGVGVAVKTTSSSKAAGHSSSVSVPGTGNPGSSTTDTPTTSAPETSTPPTTRLPGVAPVSPLSPLTVPPVTRPPVIAHPLSQPAAAIAAMVNPAVVDVDTRLSYQHAIAAGTGMVLTPNGVILTNNHVIAGATTIGAVAVGNGKSYPAHVLGVDPSADVAVLQLEGASGLATILTNSNRVSPGDAVVAIGNAGGVGGAPSVTTGVVEAIDQSIVANDPSAGISERLDGLIETTAVLEPGDSGGPLVNGAGQVIGMNTAAAVASGTSTTVSFAIPIGSALAIATQIQAGRAGGGVYLGLPPFLGVQVATGNLAGRSGVTVTAVVDGGPAAAAGIASGVLLTAMDGQLVDSQVTLARVLRQFHPGDSVAITYFNGAGASHTVRVALGTGPAD
jgi:S1-C subfamily serine protease